MCLKTADVGSEDVWGIMLTWRGRSLVHVHTARALFFIILIILKAKLIFLIYLISTPRRASCKIYQNPRTTLSGASSENLPRSFKIIGSNDRTNYDILGEYTDVTVATDEGTNFKIDSGNYYDHYAIIITRIHKISSTNNVAIRWLRYFTAPVVLNDKTWWHRENNQSTGYVTRTRAASGSETLESTQEPRPSVY